jgi:hypothetical protein
VRASRLAPSKAAGDIVSIGAAAAAGEGEQIMAIDQWWNFFYMCGSAAATLTGLMFVSVTLGATLINKDTLKQVDAFLSPLFFHFLHVFFLCCIFAVPGGDPKIVAAAAILSALWRLTTGIPKTVQVVHALTRAHERDVDLSDWTMTTVLPVVVYLALIAAGVGLLLGLPRAIDILAASCLVLLISSAKGAWDTLVSIAATLR